MATTVLNRLENWKFQQAVTTPGFGALPAEDKRVVLALAQLFGDSGWFDGRMGELVGAVVENLVVKNEGGE